MTMNCARCGERIESTAEECPFCRHDDRTRPTTPWWKSTEAVAVIALAVLLIVGGGFWWKNKIDNDNAKDKAHCESVNQFARALGGVPKKC